MMIEWIVETLKAVKTWIVKIMKKEIKLFLTVIQMIENTWPAFKI